VAHAGLHLIKPFLGLSTLEEPVTRWALIIRSEMICFSLPHLLTQRIFLNRLNIKIGSYQTTFDVSEVPSFYSDSIIFKIKTNRLNKFHDVFQIDSAVTVKTSTKKVVFLVSSGKKQISPLVPPLEKVWKNLLVPSPGKNSSDVHEWQLL